MIHNQAITCQDISVMRELLMGKKILVVDDDDDYAEAIEEVFSLQGCQVERITDPLVALDSALKEDYDMLIVDKNMPKLTGIEFVEKIREKKPTCKIIMITAHPNEESRKRSLDIGVRYYLSKPFRKNDLLEISSFLFL